MIYIALHTFINCNIMFYMKENCAY